MYAISFDMEVAKLKEKRISDEQQKQEKINQIFRDKIENIGKILNIDGVVYNYKDGTVRILANFYSERKKNLFKELIGN